MGPTYFGTKDMTVRTQPVAANVKINDQQEIRPHFHFKPVLEGLACPINLILHIVVSLPCTSLNANKAHELNS
eukprot:scaffold18151_cov63-Attheya_sp.AAC.1